MRIALWAAGLLFVLFLLTLRYHPEIYAGILYPKMVFRYQLRNRRTQGGPAGDGGRSVGFGQEAEFDSAPAIDFFFGEPPQEIHIVSIGYEWEGGSGIRLKNWKFRLWTEEGSDYYGKWGRTGEGWRYSSALGPELGMPRVFRGKRDGDEFDLALIVNYRLDGGEESTMRLEYRVKARAGEVKSLFFLI